MKLLNKLKSDRQDLISNLLDNIESLEKLAFEQQAEIERLRNSESTYRSCYESLTDMYESAKSEAIKEFAEKLPGLIPNFNGDTVMLCVERAIKHLVKEMVGDDNATH